MPWAHAVFPCPGVLVSVIRVPVPVQCHVSVGVFALQWRVIVVIVVVTEHEHTCMCMPVCLRVCIAPLSWVALHMLGMPVSPPLCTAQPPLGVR